MTYLIDAYNLLHAVGRLTPKSSHSALESARHWLIHLLNAKHSTIDPVTLVFDASRPPRNRPEHLKEWVHIEYAPSADDRIEDLIGSDSAPHKLTVVSNDHRIQQAARRRHCGVMKCLDYAEQILLHPQPATQSKPETPSDPPLKPERLSEAETAQLLEAFSDLEDDPLLRDLF